MIYCPVKLEVDVVNLYRVAEGKRINVRSAASFPCYLTVRCGKAEGHAGRHTLTRSVDFEWSAKAEDEAIKGAVGGVRLTCRQSTAVKSNP